MLFTFTLRDDASIKRNDLDGLQANAVCASRFAQGAQLGIADSKGSSNRLDSFKALTSRKNSPIFASIYCVCVCIFRIQVCWDGVGITFDLGDLPEERFAGITFTSKNGLHTHPRSIPKLIRQCEIQTSYLIWGWICNRLHTGCLKNKFCRISVTSPQNFIILEVTMNNMAKYAASW